MLLLLSDTTDHTAAGGAKLQPAGWALGLP